MLIRRDMKYGGGFDENLVDRSELFLIWLAGEPYNAKTSNRALP